MNKIPILLEKYVKKWVFIICTTSKAEVPLSKKAFLHVRKGFFTGGHFFQFASRPEVRDANS